MATAHAECLAEVRRASLAAVAAERTHSANALATCQVEHEREAAALRVKVAALEGDCVAARAEAEVEGARASACRMEHEREAGTLRLKAAALQGDCVAAKVDAEVERARAAAAEYRAEMAEKGQAEAGPGMVPQLRSYIRSPVPFIPPKGVSIPSAPFP